MTSEDKAPINMEILSWEIDIGVSEILKNNRNYKPIKTIKSWEKSLVLT